MPSKNPHAWKERTLTAPGNAPKVVADPMTGVRAPTPRERKRGPNGQPNGRTKRLSPRKIVEARRGIILDVGCGDAESKYPGAVGMDKQDLPGVDVVHDWNDFPWPFEDGSVLTIIASHVVEHVSPIDGHFLDWMNEAWRVLRVGGQMAIVCPYGTNAYWAQDPTHCNAVTERTWWYFSEHISHRYHKVD